MTRRRRSHWWITGGAVLGTAAAVLGATVPLLNYFHDQDTAEIQQRADRAAAWAVLQYRVERDEQEILYLRQAKECRP